MSKLNSSIFREYDIRGIAETDLCDENAAAIAGAVAAVFVREKCRRVSVGRDARPSSPRIAAIFIRTLAAAGLEVVDVGMVPTPVLYFSGFHLDLDGSVMITASHNPSEYNGVKINLGKWPLFGAGIRELYEIGAARAFPPAAPGRVSQSDMLPAYYERILKDVKIKRNIKAVIDAGNGIAGLTAPYLYKKLGIDLVELYCEVDGTFPNHHPDPTVPENLVDLIAKVKETGADVGIGFDGDADRIGAVDDKGRILWGDQLLLIFAREVLRTHPGAKIISEVKASEVFYREVAAAGGVPIMWKAGHSLIKQKLREEGAPLAGEVSGHIFFNDRWYGFDDAVYAGARLIELIAAQDRPFSEIVASIPPVCNTPEIRVDASDEAKFAIVERILAHYRKTHKVIDIDGARVQFEHGWALVRPSNTQPVLVLRFEADTQRHLDEIRRAVEKVIAKSKKEVAG